MVDPGTAAILVLSTITGISGYGAWKLNARRGASINEEVEERVKAIKALSAATEKARLDAEQEVQSLKKELTALKEAEKKLTSEKDRLSKDLDTMSEPEKTYRGLIPGAFKEAIQDFMKKPEIEKLGDLKKVFDPLLSRYSLSRGTAESLYRKVETVVGKDSMLPKPDFDALLLKSLKEGPSLFETKQSEEANNIRLAKLKGVALAEAKKEKAKAIQVKQDEEKAKLKEEAMAIVTSEEEVKDKQPAEDKPKKDAKTLQEIVDEALKAAKLGPLTSNTVYQSIKKPFLKGVDSVARGVQKTGEVLRKPLTQYEERQKRYKEVLEQQGGADTFDTDVYYRLFHPKEEDTPYRTLAYLFEKTSTDTSLAKNMLPVFDAFMYWRKTVLNSPILYKVELVASAQNLFKLVEPIRVNPVFQDKELKKAIEAVGKVGTRINPMTGRTADASDVRAVKESKIEPVKDFKEIIDEPPKEAALTLRTPKGGMRKKKLRTRRGVKQNVRRTRRSQNRPNRTDTYSSRRSEVDASGDELGL
jgi:hypothetical protein